MLDVFVYLDSEDRLVATTETPRAMVGEFAYLKVVNVATSIGAFLDWGHCQGFAPSFQRAENLLFAVGTG